MTPGLPDALLRRLIGRCARHWFLHRALEPLHALAARRGLTDQIRADGLRLLEHAHALDQAGHPDPHEVKDLATRAVDRFERLAGQGDAEAAFRVAEAYRTGFGRPGNHWLALEAFDRAASLGEPRAAERRRALGEREAIVDDSQARFARQALLKATYGRSEAQRRGQALRQGYRTFRVEGLGLGPALGILGAAALLLAYLFLDFYFLGLGHWRPDPTRVAWGLVGRIHPPREGGIRRVLPGWLRPDARDVAFTEWDPVEGNSRALTIAGFQGRVVYLHVIDAQHPLLFESQAYLRQLKAGLGERGEVVVLYLAGSRDTRVALSWIKEIAGISSSYADDPRAVRPLGRIAQFPLNVVIDRRGRIRQRWVGFGPGLTEEALAGALAEPE